MIESAGKSSRERERGIAVGDFGVESAANSEEAFQQVSVWASVGE